MATKKNSPTHTAYMVRNFKSGGEDRSIWTRIGSQWAHDDGKGYSLQLNAFPIDGRVMLREVKEKVDTTDEGGEEQQ